MSDYSDVDRVTFTVPVSAEYLMDAGLIPDTRPPAPALDRWTQLRWWVRDRLTVYALRQRLSHLIDPDPYKDDPRGWY